jgi:hypothetical protein
MSVDANEPREAFVSLSINPLLAREVTQIWQISLLLTHS